MTHHKGLLALMCMCMCECVCVCVCVCVCSHDRAACCTRMYGAGPDLLDDLAQPRPAAGSLGSQSPEAEAIC